jgi:hypothetical protein
MIVQTPLLATKEDIQKLKYWLDAEISLLHVGFYILLGVLIGGKFWFVAGLGIAIAVVYAFRKLSKLPKDYLK